MVDILEEIIELLTGGIASMASGIGGGLTALVKAIFVTGTGTAADPYALSVFGGIVVVFAAISLAVGLSRWVTSFITSLGARN